MLDETRVLLKKYAKKVDLAASRQGGSDDPVDRLQKLISEPWVLFAGAGLSVDQPTSAPTFSHLRNAVAVALCRRLMTLGYLSQKDARIIEAGFIEVDGRPDISLPPEVFFEDVGNHLGRKFMNAVLLDSLSGQSPNIHHRAIRELSHETLVGVITPNFDNYIEQALAGMAIHRIVGTKDLGGNGLILYKVHGSVDLLDDVQIMAFEMVAPLFGRAREIFKSIVEDRTIVVFGYSGQDRDLFPLLIHAGGAWGSRVVWLVYDDNSINEPLAAMQLALQDRCEVVPTHGRAVLAELANLEFEKNVSNTSSDLQILAARFETYLGALRPESLIATLLQNVHPLDIVDVDAITSRLASVLVDLTQKRSDLDPEARLKLMGLGVGFMADSEQKKMMQRICLELAKQWGSALAIRAWSQIVAGEEEDDGSSEYALRKNERDQREWPEIAAYSASEPNWERVNASIEIGMRINHALLLWDVGRIDEAESEARALLAEAPWPNSAMENHFYFERDATAHWRLHSVLARAEVNRKNNVAADKHLVTIVKLLWEGSRLWDLTNALNARVSTLARQVGAYDVERSALELSLALSDLASDEDGRRVALAWINQTQHRRPSPRLGKGPPRPDKTYG